MAEQHIVRAKDGASVFDLGRYNSQGDPTLAVSDDDVLDKLQELLVELQSKFESGGEVALDATSLAALESISATITNLPADYPDTATHTNLQTIAGKLDSLLTELQSQQTDGLTDTELRATPVPVDTGLTTQTNALTDTELRATPVPVDTGLTTQTDGLTDAQLRAAPVSVSTGLTTQTDALTDTELRASDVEVNDNESQAILSKRFNGGKLSIAGTAASSGNNTLITPTAGSAIRLYWFYAASNPSATSPPLIKVRFGAAGDDVYSFYGALAHWEIIEGAADEPLILNIGSATNTAWSVTYEEFVP